MVDNTDITNPKEEENQEKQQEATRLASFVYDKFILLKEQDNLMKTDGLKLFIIIEVSIIKMFNLESMRNQESL